MALRVLLADESSTIKKVMQLALQDFAVEVKSVPVGLDVLAVTKTFKPDIVFADVLLTKRSGYEVCSDLKKDSETSNVPVVLMWSGFMELDEDKFQASHADQQLEKPFDVAALRKLVTDLVPRTQKQKISEFLTFPKLQSDADETEAEEAAPDLVADEEFKQVSIPKMKGGTDKYRIDLKPEELEPGHIAVDYEMPPEKVDTSDPAEEFQVHEGSKRINPGSRGETVLLDEEEIAELRATEVERLPEVEPENDNEVTAAGRSPMLSSDQLEQIIRQQSTEVIEQVVWKVVPELAKQIIERELKRLLKERDSHPY